MADIIDRLRGLAGLFEAGDAPRHLVLHMRAGADEIERLRAGGCARDQSTTQFCHEAAKKDAEISSLLNTLADARTESMKLRAALEPFAAEADCWPDHHDDEPLVESFPKYDGKITVGACRRARAALEVK